MECKEKVNRFCASADKSRIYNVCKNYFDLSFKQNDSRVIFVLSFESCDKTMVSHLARFLLL